MAIVFHRQYSFILIGALSSLVAGCDPGRKGVVTDAGSSADDLATTDFATTDFTTSDFATTDFATSDFATSDFATSDFATSDFATSDLSVMDLATVDLTSIDMAIPPPVLVDDYLIQDVCAPPNAAALAVDPYDPCPQGSARRDLLIGEALPYHRHDQPDGNNPIGFQRHDSFPRPGPTGTRFVHPFDFPPFGEFNPNDGYDVAEAEGSLAAIAGTRDPGGLSQTFFSPNCPQFGDGWLLLPTKGFLNPGSQIAMLNIAAWEKAGQPFPGACPKSFNPAYTSWQELKAFSFGGQNGARTKTLDAILSSHYGGADPATADHIEKFYLTRLYGLTRWERWQNGKLHPGTMPKPQGCNGATTDGDFIRVDCRDWTNIVIEALPWPAQSWPTPYADSNRLVNGDFGANSVVGWNRIGVSQGGAMTNWSLVQDNTGSTYLATNCGGNCTPGQGIYQDVPIGTLTGQFRFGGRFRTDAGNGSAELVVFQRDAQAAVIERDSVSLNIGPGDALTVSGNYTVQPNVTQLRFQFYLNAPNTFHLDDLWIARAP